MSEVLRKGKSAKLTSLKMAGIGEKSLNEALALISKQLKEDQDDLLKENERDLREGREKGLTDSVLDRILLNPKRIEDMANAIDLLIEMPSPLGETLEEIEKENGLKICKKRVPIGVIGMIYEARPNVTIDAATLALKTANAIILRGSSSAKYSNAALVKTIHSALAKSDVPVDAVQLIEDTSRETAKEMFRLNEYLDVLIPRGGKQLIETVIKESSVPVIETGAGNCHVFIDESADPLMAEKIVMNAKLQRPSVCNAIETVLVDKSWLEKYGKDLLVKLHEHDVIIYGDEQVQQMVPFVKKATEDHWGQEFIGLEIAVKTVDAIEEAIAHINEYGTKHSESIVTMDESRATLFLTLVDAAAVYHNASTRFTDGFEFGYGAEIGISTQKLHARGPMGLQALTSTKFFIYGDGQIRN